MVTPDRNNSILAHRLFFSSFYENHLKLGINDNDPKDTGQEGFDANDAAKVQKRQLSNLNKNDWKRTISCLDK